MRGLVKGKCWLLLSRWVNLNSGKRKELNQLFALNRRVIRRSEHAQRFDSLRVKFVFERNPFLCPLAAKLNRKLRWVGPQAVQADDPSQALLHPPPSFFVGIALTPADFQRVLESGVAVVTQEKVDGVLPAAHYGASR